MDEDACITIQTLLLVSAWVVCGESWCLALEGECGFCSPILKSGRVRVVCARCIVHYTLYMWDLQQVWGLGWGELTILLLDLLILLGMSDDR